MTYNSNSKNKKPSIHISKVKESFNKTSDFTARAGSHYMGPRQKQSYKEELQKRYGDNFDKSTEIKKEVERLKNLERAARRGGDYFGANEYKDKIELIENLMNL